uniref:Ejaculatory bulb-specific protein 3 n=1 Tax=Cacopsylla melanoneura TaxID=428564 RepID=A0A8D9BJ08_9HEMI
MLKFVVLLSAAACVYAASAPYTTKYDNINLDEILANDRLVSSYIKCLLDEGTCTPDGAELKSVLPDALKTSCTSCSQKQRSGSKRIFKFLIEKKPEEWAKLEQKYDPEGTYKTKYQAELKALNVNAPVEEAAAPVVAPVDTSAKSETSAKVEAEAKPVETKSESENKTPSH